MAQPLAAIYVVFYISTRVTRVIRSLKHRVHHDFDGITPDEENPTKQQRYLDKEHPTTPEDVILRKDIV